MDVLFKRIHHFTLYLAVENVQNPPLKQNLQMCNFACGMSNFVISSYQYPIQLQQLLSLSCLFILSCLCPHPILFYLAQSYKSTLHMFYRLSLPILSNYSIIHGGLQKQAYRRTPRNANTSILSLIFSY